MKWAQDRVLAASIVIATIMVGGSMSSLLYVRCVAVCEVSLFTSIQEEILGRECKSGRRNSRTRVQILQSISRTGRVCRYKKTKRRPRTMQELPVEGRPNRRTEYSKEKEKSIVQKGCCDEW